MVLRVCTAEELPEIDDRDQTYIYFVYNKMRLYYGHSFYTDPFCLVESIPEDPVEDMLYIQVLDGNVYVYHNHITRQIATIENPDQVEYLLKAGTNYFMKADYRYLDLQTKTIQLPYENGNYQLTVSLGKDIKIDSNTIIRYDETTGRFIIDGDLANDEFNGAPYIHEYKGRETKSAKTTIKKPGEVKVDVKLSEFEGNGLRVYDNGIYAVAGEPMSVDDFNEFMAAYAIYKANLEEYIENIDQTIDDIMGDDYQEMVNQKILEALEQYIPNVQSVLENYDNILQQLGNLRDNVSKYSDEYLEHTKEEIIEYINQIDHAWSELDSDDYSDSKPYNGFSDDELQVQSMVLDTLHQKFLELRDIDGDYQVPVDFYFVTDNNEFDDEGIDVIIPSLELSTEISPKLNYTRIRVNTPKVKDTNMYYYKITTVLPIAGEDVLNWNSWDGESDLEIPNETNIVITEADIGKAVKAGKIKVKTRTTDLEGLGILTVSSVNSGELNTTILTVSPEKDPNNTYFIGAPDIIPQYNSVVPEEMIEWDGESEVRFDEYEDYTMLIIIEADNNLNRAKKLGMFFLDKNTNPVSKLKITSSADEVYLQNFQTVLTVTPRKVDTNLYFFKATGSERYPLKDEIANTSMGYTEWDGVSPVTFTIGDKMLLVETTPDNKIKKAGITTPILENRLRNITINYSDRYPSIDFIIIEDKRNGCKIFVREFDPETEIVNRPLAGSKLNTSKYKPYYITDGVEVSKEGNKFVVIECSPEEYDKSVVGRSAIVDSVILYSENIQFITLEGSSYGTTRIRIDEEYDITETMVYYEIVNDIPQEDYIVNTPIDSSSQLYQDDETNIDLNTYLSDDFYILIFFTNIYGGIIKYSYIPKSEVNINTTI